MNNWTELILPALCLLLGLINLIKYLRYKNSFSLVGIIPIFSFLALTIVSLGILNNKLNQNFLININIIYAFLALCFACTFTAFILNLIPEWKSKKIKTMLRVPLIGALLGHFLSEHVFGLLLGLELVLLVLSYKYFAENRHIARLQRKQVLFYPLLIWATFSQNIQGVFLYLLLVHTFKNAILNAVVIKNIIYKNNQSEINV
jgi:hypothetical protein